MQTLGKVGKARRDLTQTYLPSLNSGTCEPMQTTSGDRRLWSSIVKDGSKSIQSSDQSSEPPKGCDISSEKSAQSKSKPTGYSADEESETIYVRKGTKGKSSVKLPLGTRSKKSDKKSALTPKEAVQEYSANKYGTNIDVTIKEDQTEMKYMPEYSFRPQSNFMAVSRAKDCSIKDQSLAVGLGSDEEITQLCTPCERDGTVEAGFGYCENCNEVLCKSCFKHHKKATTSRHHTLLDKDKMSVRQQPHLQQTAFIQTLLSSTQLTQPSLSSTSAQPEFASTLTTKLSPPSTSMTQPQFPSTRMTTSHEVRGYCSKHQEEPLKYICYDHRRIACGVCVMLKHRNCNIEYIPDVSKHIINSKEYFETSEKMETFVKRCKDIKDETKQIVEASNESLKSVIPIVKYFRQKVDERFTKLENDIAKMSENMCKENNKKLNRTEVTCDYIEKSIRGESNEIRNLNATGQTDALFIYLTESEKILAEHEEYISNLKLNLEICEYEFLRNPSLTCLLENEMALGTIQPKGQLVKEQPELPDKP